MARPPLPDPLREALDREPPADRDALAALWHDAAPLAEAPSVDTDAAWDRVRRRAGLPSPGPSRLNGRRRRPPARRAGRRWPVALAAVAVAAVAALAAWWTQPVVRTAGPGQTLAVALPDGSAVELNSGSRLTHARGFGALWGTPEARHVRLDGEAYFDVRPGAAPFVVHTFNARVEVLGTAFNVEARRDEGATAVALVHGRVRLAGGTGAHAAGATLRPGQVGRVVEDEPGRARLVPPVEADVERRAAWRAGGLVFEAEPLRAVLAEVGRRYDTAFELADGVPADAPTTAFYARRPALEALLGDLGAAWGVRFVPVRGGWRVEAAPRAGSAGGARPSA